MEEIIATRSKKMANSPKICLILGVVAFVLGVIDLFISSDGCRFTFVEENKTDILATIFTLFFAGILFLVIAAVQWARIRKIPPVIIVYRDGVLNFYDGFSCAIEKVESVRCEKAYRRRWGYYMDGAGSLKFVADGKTKTYRMIENVEEANDRIQKLMIAARENKMTNCGRDYNG